MNSPSKAENSRGPQNWSSENNDSQYNWSHDSFFGQNGFGDIFERFVRGNMRFNSEPVELHVECNVEVSFLDAAKGGTKVIEYQKLEDCDRCGGSGYTKNSKTTDCRVCKGRGTSTKSVGGILYSTTCINCGGLGKANIDQCNLCSGNGVSYRSAKINFNIPSGITDEYQYSIKGAGNFVRGKRGDLLVSFKVKWLNVILDPSPPQISTTRA